MSILDKIVSLTKSLYPNGRAFGLFDGSVLSDFNYALSVKEAQVYADALSILDSTIPDNDNFNEDDASEIANELIAAATVFSEWVEQQK